MTFHGKWDETPVPVVSLDSLFPRFRSISVRSLSKQQGRAAARVLRGSQLVSVAWNDAEIDDVRRASRSAAIHFESDTPTSLVNDD